jgi:glutathione S-transferase
MKLYYNPYGCSLAPAIVAAEAGIVPDYVFVDVLKEPHRLSDGTNYSTINPRNYVPLLELDNGQRMSEVAVILQYLADLLPGQLAPEPGMPERYKVQEWLTFIGTELHKMYSPWLFHPEVGETAQAYARGKIDGRYRLIDQHLKENDYLLGDDFSIADAYLFVPVNWAAAANTPLAEYPNILAWFERMNRRPAVAAALQHHSAKPKKLPA